MPQHPTQHTLGKFYKKWYKNIYRNTLILLLSDSSAAESAEAQVAADSAEDQVAADSAMVVFA